MGFTFNIENKIQGFKIAEGMVYNAFFVFQSHFFNLFKVFYSKMSLNLLCFSVNGTFLWNPSGLIYFREDL